jgi:predicted nucleic acid-binding protein
MYANLFYEPFLPGKCGRAKSQLALTIAIYHNLILVTRNIKDYQRIPNLKLYQVS